MKYLKYLVLVAMASYLGLGQPLNAQPLQKHNHSLRFEMGLFQYNENSNDFIFQNNNDFLSGGLTYRREIGRIFAMNVTGRYNEWNMDEGMSLQTYAFQALWEIHTARISSSWRTNRITPYIGAGIGYENHNLTSPLNDTVQQKVYIPLEVGVLFNLSPRWSIGVFSEYKLASVSPIDNLLESPKLRLDLSNIAGVSLSYNFGRNKKEQSVPVIRTNQSLVPKRVVKEVVKEPVAVTPKKVIMDSTITSLQGKVKDSTVVRPEEKTRDSARVVLKEADADSTTMTPGKAVADSSMILAEKTAADSTMVLDEKVADSTLVSGDSKLVDGILPSDSTYKSNLTTPMALDSSAVRKDALLLSKRIEIIADTIRVPVILDITVNTKNNLAESNYTVENASKVQPANKGAVASPAPVYANTSQQIQGQLGQIDKNISALKDQYRNQNSNIESELKNMKVMLGVLNAEILLLSALKSKSPEKEKEKEVQYVTSPAPSVNIDSLAYLIDSIRNLNNTDSVNLGLANVNVSLLAEVNKLQSENKALTDKLASMSRIVESSQISDSLDKVVYAVTFAVNSTKVDVGQLVQLKPLLDLLKKRSDYKLLLSGFTDKSGNANYNMMLSKKRVLAVKEELSKMGINKARIVEQYFGSEKASAANNENDRKVELKVVKSF